jgi:hypothetical protein
MNKTIAAVATFAALGAGALGVHAFDLKGSDTLKKLTVQVVAACPGAAGVINYVGGGSGAGESAMVAGTQHVSPMSRFLAGTGTSGVCAVDTTKAEAIEIAGDAIIISMNNAHHAACDPNQGGALDNACQGYTSGGLDRSRTLSTGVTLTSWKDTLRLVYMGLAPNDFPLAAGTGPGDQVLAANIARRNCEDPSRLELVNTFGKLFDIDCGSDGGCTKLQHAFRRDENSGTTDFFRETLGVESGTQFGNKGFPFCNEYVPAVTINSATSTAPGNGVACTSNAQCTAAGYSQCVTGTCHRPSNGCTVASSAADCPSGFSCDPGQLQCAQTCSIGNDATCSSVIPGATCHAAGVCKPGTCTTDADCGGAAGSCDTSSGSGLCKMPPSKVSCTAAAQCPGVGATCTIPSDMNASTGWCTALVDAPASDAKVETRCSLPGVVGGTQPGTVASVPGVFRSGTAGVGFENQQNNDPVRRLAIGKNGLTGAAGGSLDANPAEQVATACGDNGVVLPISIPSDTVNAFPNTVCGFGKVSFFPAIPIVGGANARWQLCPNGDMPLGATGWDPVIRGAIRGSGTCLTPVKPTDASSANCISGSTNRPAATFSLPPAAYVTLPALVDARVYNNDVWLPASSSRLTQAYEFNGQEQGPTPTPPDTATAFNEQVTGAFYRIHSTRSAKGYSNATVVCNANADCPAATPTCDVNLHACFTNSEAGCTAIGPDGTANVCCELGQDTNQIGCLTIASPCSMGFAGLASASCANSAEQLTTKPVAGGTLVVGTNFSVGLDHAAVGGVVKEVSGCASNACIPADVAAAGTLQYPIARNLYFSSVAGFESATVTSGELALGQCLSGTLALTSGTVNSLIDANGFVSNLGNYACCRDFSEAGCTATASSTNNACANNGSVNMPSNTCAF